MSTFRTALRVVAAHPIYLALYVVMLSVLGVFVVGAAAPASASGGSAPAAARVAVVDRDGSALSRALGAWVGRAYERVEVPDEKVALQDALATGAVDCVLVLPDGFGSDLVTRARGGEEPPSLEAAYGTDVQAGALAAADAAQWVSLAASAAALEPGAGEADLAELADAAAAERVEPRVSKPAATDASARGLATYLSFSTYSVTSSIVVVAGVTLAAFGRRDLRRRLAAAPRPPARLAAGELGACAVLVLAVWAWTCAVALAACHASLAGADPALVAAALLVMLVLAFVPLGLAFLLAQLGLGDDAINAVGNLGSMVLSLLGGAWVPLSLLPAAVRSLARLSPSYWASDAVSTLLSAPALGTDELACAARAVGILALYAVALFALGLALGRARRRVAGA